MIGMAVAEVQGRSIQGACMREVRHMHEVWHMHEHEVGVSGLLCSSALPGVWSFLRATHARASYYSRPSGPCDAEMSKTR